VFANESAVSADVRTTEGERERASERERETESCQRRGFGVVRRSISQGQILPTAAPVPPVRSALCPPIFACERVCACVCVLARARVRAYSRERERQRERQRERERQNSPPTHTHTMPGPAARTEPAVVHTTTATPKNSARAHRFAPARA
jgi:hypothetical protein